MADAEPQSVVQARRHARASGLLYVCDTEPGISRKRAGTGFRYLGPNRRAVHAARTLERIRKLAIPPAYTDVWICTEPQGHLQATGRDARRRKQYRYHVRWRETRDNGKFSRMIEFGERLPRLRRRLKHDRALAGLPKNKVLAVVVTLLEETLVRVGNEEYARANGSFGLTTLRARHVKFLRDGRASFNFRGKGGKLHEIVLDNRRLAAIIRKIQQLPGQLLFQYIDDEGKRQAVDSGMVNEYLREVMADNGEGFTAKDFRTWGATVRAIAHLSCEPRDKVVSDTAFNRCVAATARHVADALGNTPAVCRKSYINPAVFVAWRGGTIDALVPHTSLNPRQMEKIALKILRRQDSRR
ncbi:DNA topoisomerase IB [Povalibacter uvarum]|uniref:DNA topoisomerase n=1 Tax=Povalibacter uvarum TaxID=732238 RepID=A0A841HTQ0_9GAMM|nr:DNA topoisomerase IB [Povalibacter uvarum]MBB6095378.1 DNA topoisomerase IB [Povalibacter uvarum]